MKKILIICVLLINAVIFSYAQGDRGGFGGADRGGFGGRGQGNAQARTPEQRAQTTLDDLLSSFTLNKENRAKTLAILTAQNISLDSLTATMPPATADLAVKVAAAKTLQTQRLAIMQANEAKFIALLSDKQKKLYEGSIKDRPANRGFGQSGGGGANGGGGGGRGQGGEGRAGGDGNRGFGGG
jgi:hypothetical protein